MNNFKKTGKKTIIHLLVAGAIVGAYFLYNTSSLSAAINDCLNLSGNLIQNCSFENPTPLPAGYVTHTTGHVMLLNGYTGLTGWKVIAPVKNSNIGYFLPGFPAPSGTKVLDLSGFVDINNPKANGEQAGAGIEQTVSGLTAGRTYTLKFSQGYLAPFASQIAVNINGVNQGTFNLDSTTAGPTINTYGVIWKEQTVTFVADSSVATIQFIHTIAQPGGKIIIYGSALDNVSLVPVAPTRTPAVDQVVQLPTPTIKPVEQVQSPTPTLTSTTTCSDMATVAKLSDKEVFDLALNKKIGQCTISDLRGTSSYCDYYVNSAAVGKLGATGYPKNPASGDSTGCVVAPTLPKGINTCWGGYDKDTMCTVDYVKNAANQVRKAITDNACGCTAPTTTTPIKDVPTSPIKNLVEVSINSSNNNPRYATVQDVVTLNYTLDQQPTKNKVILGGQPVTPVCDGVAPIYKCSAAIIVTKNIPTSDGLVVFSISITTRSSTGTMTETTDGSYVIVKRKGDIPTETVDPTQPTTPVVVTGSCTTGSTVMISGTDITPRTGLTTCVDGTYNVPVTTTGNPSVTVTETATHPEIPPRTHFDSTPKDPTPVKTEPPVGDEGTVTTTTYVPPAVTTTSSGPTKTDSVWGTPQAVDHFADKCIPEFTEYLIKGDRDGSRGVTEVSKVQSFLNRYMGISLSVDGVFDSNTDRAVKLFQGKYVPNIIIPWEISGPTGWWYQSTRSYANYLTGCSEGPVRLDNGVRLLDGQIIN